MSSVRFFPKGEKELRNSMKSLISSSSCAAVDFLSQGSCIMVASGASYLLVLVSRQETWSSNILVEYSSGLFARLREELDGSHSPVIEVLRCSSRPHASQQPEFFTQRSSQSALCGLLIGGHNNHPSACLHPQV